MVEHNLAKVGVAGSSPVSRFISFLSSSFSARVAKPVDARDLKSLGIRSHAGSIPAPSIHLDMTLSQQPFITGYLEPQVCKIPDAPV